MHGNSFQGFEGNLASDNQRRYFLNNSFILILFFSRCLAGVCTKVLMNDSPNAEIER